MRLAMPSVASTVIELFDRAIGGFSASKFARMESLIELDCMSPWLIETSF